MIKFGFGSDNHSGIHPDILKAIAAANVGHAPSYGTDPLTEKAQEVFKKYFGKNARAYFVFNGTAANVLSLQALTKPFQSILTSQASHINVDECGAPERSIGCKLITIPTTDGKLTPAMLEPYIIRGGDQHFSQPKTVSITQPTEYGTLYSLEEIAALSTFCKRHRLYLHIDGARLIHAATRLGCSLEEVTKGADVVSFGGTKNGLMFGEAVIFLTPGLDEDFKYSRKQLMQLPSKTRFISAQFLELLEGDLWKRISQHCLSMSDLLAQKLQTLKTIEITQTVQSNAVFALFPKHIIGPLRDEYFFYVWNEATFEVRLMTTFDTQAAHIDGFVKKLSELL